MSYSYERIDRRRRSTGGYGASTRRTTFGYWVPLALTVTVATIGLAAWIWSEKNDDEDDTSDHEHYPGGVPPPGYASMSGGLPAESGNPPGFQGPPPDARGPPSAFGGPPGPSGDFARSTGVETQDERTLMGKMSGALKRTPSPQQSYDWASKKVAAGVAAAGAMVGGALTSIREGSQEDYEDHERWSEEADNRDNHREPKQGIKRKGTADEFFAGQVEMPRQASINTKKRKTVAIVVSAVEHEDDGMGELGQHASVLAHLPEHVDPDLVRVFALIYVPNLKTHPLSVGSTKAPSSLTSSYSNIAHEDAHPSEKGRETSILDNIDPNPIDDTTPLFKTLYNQAQALVDKDTMIIPFTTPNGHSHILRSLGPQTVYIQESLCGEDGDIVANLSGWVKETVVVVGDEGGHGGLVDTDDEGTSGKEKHEKWWQKEERTGLGKRVAVVDSLRVGEDWRRRVGGHD